MSWEHFEYSVADGVATVRLNRPDRLNALTFDVYRDLARLTDELRTDDDVRVLLLTGSGKGFCSGGDVDDIIGVLLEQDAESILDFTRLTCEVVRNLRRMPQVVIAAVNGTAAGAGAVLALASDLRLCSDSAKFHFLFTKVGLTGADMGTAWMLPRVVGMGRATQALLFGDPITAKQALEWGLANTVVPGGDLIPEARRWAHRLADGPREALQSTKRALQVEAEMSFEAALDYEAFAQANLLRFGDHREFHAAHSEKRPPRWNE